MRQARGGAGTGWLVLLLVPALCGGGCRRPDAARPAAEAGGRPPGPGIAGRARPEPISLGPLVAESTPRVVEKLARAHYDAQALGLQELGFVAQCTFTSTRAEVVGEGRWTAAGGVEVKLRSLTRDGVKQTHPVDAGLNPELWGSLQLQLQGLLRGLGRGFLSERLAGWRRLEGRARMSGEKLSLVFTEEGGETTVTVGANYLIERVVNRSPQKVTRTMTYTHQLSRGRNLVTRAEFRVEIDAGADIPPRAAKLLRASDGLTFEIVYGSVGGYLLPTTLRKHAGSATARAGDDVTLTLRYTRLR